MTREEFIQILEKKGYSYKIEGDKLVVTFKGFVDFESLTSLPPGVEFKNRGGVYLRLLKTLPPGVKFKNGGDVDLGALTSLPPGVEFKNGDNVFLESLKTLPPGVVFKNGGTVYLESLIGGWFNDWKGNIDGVDSQELLNLMIKRGMFI